MEISFMPGQPEAVKGETDAVFAAADGFDPWLMRMAIEESRANADSSAGGPFGAVIARDGIVVAAAHNRVLETGDPTMHAEVAAIRLACEKLGRFSLRDCVIYASCQPCPMCLAAIMWAKISVCFYACTREDAAAIGFNDLAIYRYIRGEESGLGLTVINRMRDEALPALGEWAHACGRMY